MAAVALSEVLSAKSIICDIEGTTTSISFVKDILFPYALKNVEDYLKNNWNEDATKTVVAALREQADEDKKAEVEGAVPIPAGDTEEIIPDIVKNVEWQMSQDRKTGSLKTLQGLVWAKGYKDGTIKGHVYDDVQKSFEQWTESGRKIYIYSSGSVDAQKLLFENSEQGNLLKYLAGHYDTKIGAKREKESYQSILKNIEAKGEEALFLTDVVAEAKAAKEAGLHVVLLDRPGNTKLSEDERKEFPVISTFSDISFAEKEGNGAALNGKRKIDETTETTEDDKAQEPPSKVVKVEEGKKDEVAANGAAEAGADKEMTPTDDAVDAATETKKPEEVSEKKADGMEVDDEKEGDDKKNLKSVEEKNSKEDEKMDEDDDKVKPDAVENKEQVDSKEPSSAEEEGKKDSGATMEVDEQDSAEAKKKEEKEEVKSDDEGVKESKTTEKSDAVNDDAKKSEDIKTDDKKEEKETTEKEKVTVEKETAKETEDKNEDTKETKEEQKSVEENAKQEPKELQKESPESVAEQKPSEMKQEEHDKPVAEEEKKKESDKVTADVEVTSGVEEAKSSAPADEVATEVKGDEKPEKTQPDEPTAATKKEEKKTNGDVVEPTNETSTAAKEADAVESKAAATATATANGEKTEDKPATNGSSTSTTSTGQEEKNADSDKENDVSTTNCETDEAAAAVTEKTNGSTTPVVESTTTTTCASSGQEATAAVAEIKPKKVVDVVAPAVTPTPPIEAES